MREHTPHCTSLIISRTSLAPLKSRFEAAGTSSVPAGLWPRESLFSECDEPDVGLRDGVDGTGIVGLARAGTEDMKVKWHPDPVPGGWMVQSYVSAPGLLIASQACVYSVYLEKAANAVYPAPSWGNGLNSGKGTSWLLSFRRAPILSTTT
jgi:hypothetical protein